MAPAAPDFIFVVVSKEDVWSEDLDETLRVLRYLATSPEALSMYRERVDIQFDGFNDDPRELWEIPEVRSFVARVDEQFPFWLYFMSRHGTGLLAVVRCFLLPHLTREAEAQTNNPKLADLLMRRWLPALNHMAARAGMTEVDLLRLSDSAVEYLMGGQSRLAQTPLDRLLDDVQRNGRICPQPNAWNEVWQMLPKSLKHGPPKPGLPLILAAWWEASPEDKRERFLSHLRYAEATYMLDEVEDYLRGLPESDWFHGTDG